MLAGVTLAAMTAYSLSRLLSHGDVAQLAERAMGEGGEAASPERRGLAQQKIADVQVRVSDCIVSCR